MNDLASTWRKNLKKRNSCYCTMFTGFYERPLSSQWFALYTLLLVNSVRLALGTCLALRHIFRSIFVEFPQAAFARQRISYHNNRSLLFRWTVQRVRRFDSFQPRLCDENHNDSLLPLYYCHSNLMKIIKCVILIALSTRGPWQSIATKFQQNLVCVFQ